MMDSLAVKIRNEALKMGYEKCGIISVSDMEGYEDKLNERIERIPESEPYIEGFRSFAHLQALYPWAKSVVVCVRRYGKYRIPEHLQGLIGKYYLTDSRTDEDSEGFKASLMFEESMQSLGIKTLTERKFGITALRWAAFKAGLGIVRKNNFFYTESGSWVYLEAWLIDKDLRHIEVPDIRKCPDNCNLCIKNCPTSSLSEPYTMNRSSCISCLTTWEGWDLAKEKYNSQMGSWIYGCDVCQDVCPMNKGKWSSEEEFPGLNGIGESISLEKILAMDYDYLGEIIQRKFWYIEKNNVWKWKINVINSMVNGYKDRYREPLLKACSDRNAGVRRTASWAIEKLGLR